MIRKAQELTTDRVEGMRGGQGILHATALLKNDEFYGKGRMFSMSVLEPGASVGYHQHVGDFEAYYIVSGQGIYNDNGTDVPVQAGDVTICNDGEFHGLINTGKKDLSFIALILYTA